jgi:hypothetical protein
VIRTPERAGKNPRRTCSTSPKLAEGLALRQPDLLPDLLGNGLGRDHHRMNRNQSPPVTRNAPGVSLGRHQHDVCAETTPRREYGASLDLSSGGSLVDRGPRPLDDLGKPSCEPGRVERGAVGRVEASEVRPRSDTRGTLLGLEPRVVLLSEPERSEGLDLTLESLPVRRDRRHLNGSALGKVAVDPLRSADSPDLVDGVEHRALDREPPLAELGVPVVLLDPRDGPDRPASVSSRGPEARDLGFHERNANVRFQGTQVVRRPESRIARADDRDVDIRSALERGARRELTGDVLVPEAFVSVVAGRHR